MRRGKGNLHLATIAITPRSWFWRVTRAGYLSPKALLRAFLFRLPARPDSGAKREGKISATAAGAPASSGCAMFDSSGHF
jgi:hypothetical protein